MRAIWIISVFLVTAMPTAKGKSVDDCAKIEDNKERLSCFDKAFSEKESGTKTENPDQKPVADEQTEETNLVNEQALRVDSATTVQNSKKDVLVIDQEEAFGKKKIELVQIKSIESHIVGTFKGWKKGQILTLANGQKWKVMNQRSGYVNTENPKVIISEGFWGSFNMKVEGLNAAAKVKRIK
ncbi:MAG: type VI secretion protein [Gammaproteobacteria bacterium]|nr:type VI secretion protein [Gammaproteobacteria bacterium]